MYLGLSGANVDLLHSVGHEKKKKKKKGVHRIVSKGSEAIEGHQGLLAIVFIAIESW